LRCFLVPARRAYALLAVRQLHALAQKVRRRAQIAYVWRVGQGIFGIGRACEIVVLGRERFNAVSHSQQPRPVTEGLCKRELSAAHV